jgi:hypothetical protein
METYQFRVYAFHPKEYRAEFYSLLDKEKIHYTTRIEETAPPPGLIKDIVSITASTLTILKILYDYSKEIKKKKGEQASKIIIRANGEDFDLEAYNIDELKVIIESRAKS